MQILANYTENHLSSNFEDPWKHLVVKNNLYRWKTSYAKLKNVCFWCDVLSPCDNGSYKLPSIDAAEFGNSAERELNPVMLFSTLDFINASFVWKLVMKSLNDSCFPIQSALYVFFFVSLKEQETNMLMMKKIIKFFMSVFLYLFKFRKLSIGTCETWIIFICIYIFFVARTLFACYRRDIVQPNL